ncbi:MAG: phosphoglycerate dehydrogenase [Eubacteriales bacterium]|nr:phosphoglycerate dehydrogenase [Eubacteriales bacterium]
MEKIVKLNSISEMVKEYLPENRYCICEKADDPVAVLVRSADMHGMKLPDSVLAVARAGAGVNNIPLDELAEEGVVVFNTPGANANAVKEMVLCGLLLSGRGIVDGINWVSSLKGKGAEVGKLVEKGKGQFVGHEIKGKTLGVIGLGAIGAIVANDARNLGMNVLGCDPYISVAAAWSLSRGVRKAETYDEIYEKCDYITLHVPANDSTKNMINAESIAKMKDGVVVLNFARGTLVNTADMLAALESGKVARYVTDFPDDDLIGAKNVIAIPHLGASTPESEDNCAALAAQELADYLENGNIKNSVNFPACHMEKNTPHRVSVLHKNLPNMVGQITSKLASVGVNINNMMNQSRGINAYSLLDIDTDVDPSVLEEIEALDGMIRVRKIY